MRKLCRSGALTLYSFATPFLFTPPTLLKFSISTWILDSGSSQWSDCFRPIIVSHSKCAQPSAFFHSSTGETDDGKEEECGKFVKQRTKRIRILKRQNTPI